MTLQRSSSGTKAAESTRKLNPILKHGYFEFKGAMRYERQTQMMLNESQDGEMRMVLPRRSMSYEGHGSCLVFLLFEGEPKKAFLKSFYLGYGCSKPYSDTRPIGRKLAVSSSRKVLALDSSRATSWGS